VAASFMASPIAIDGKLLIMSQDGDTFVIKAGPTTRWSAPTRWASRSAPPRPCRRPMFIRGERHLFAIGRVVSPGASP